MKKYIVMVLENDGTVTPISNPCAEEDADKIILNSRPRAGVMWKAPVLFNPNPHHFAVGDRVNYHSIIGGPITSVHTITHIRSNSFGEYIVWLEGKAGYVAEDSLTPFDSTRQEEDNEH